MLAERIEALCSLGPRHTEIGKEMFSVHEGDLYLMDFLGAAVLNRSMRLIRGFSDLIASNFMSGAPLVRLQLDNLLRFHAAFLVKDPHGFVMGVLGGRQINTLTSLDGARLTDAYLVRSLEGRYPDIGAIYDRGCGYVHLSDLHVLHAVQSDGGNRIEITISEEESEVSDEIRLDAVDTMILLTQRILSHIRGWIYTKANPELVQEPLEQVRFLLDRGSNGDAKSLLQRIIRDHPDPDLVAKAKQILETLGDPPQSQIT